MPIFFFDKEKIALNHPMTYKKLHCKGGPYRFSGKRDPLLQTKKILLFYIKGKFMLFSDLNGIESKVFYLQINC